MMQSHWPGFRQAFGCRRMAAAVRRAAADCDGMLLQDLLAGLCSSIGDLPLPACMTEAFFSHQMTLFCACGYG